MRRTVTKPVLTAAAVVVGGVLSLGALAQAAKVEPHRLQPKFLGRGSAERDRRGRIRRAMQLWALRGREAGFAGGGRTGGRISDADTVRVRFRPG